MTGQRTPGKRLKLHRLIFQIAIALLIGAAAFIRLAPSDPAHWHTDPGTIPVRACGDLTTTQSGARVTCLRLEDPTTLLANLDSIALASPRTTRLAGSAETGRITWITRSFLWGFPDYTTAQATITPAGARLDVVARQRFGGSDWGVNAARLAAWLTAL